MSRVRDHMLYHMTFASSQLPYAPIANSFSPISWAWSNFAIWSLIIHSLTFFVLLIFKSITKNLYWVVRFLLAVFPATSTTLPNEQIIHPHYRRLPNSTPPLKNMNWPPKPPESVTHLTFLSPKTKPSCARYNLLLQKASSTPCMVHL